LDIKVRGYRSIVIVLSKTQCYGKTNSLRVKDKKLVQQIVLLIYTVKRPGLFSLNLVNPVAILSGKHAL